MASSKKSETEEMDRLQGILHSATALMSSQVKHEDVAIFIGATKSGKSTLINYLIGNPLNGVRPTMFRPVSIEKGNKCDGPEIGSNAASATIIPSRWDHPAKLPGLVIWDAPGFEDNRGVLQDIANAFYVYELFKSIKSAKIVLVTDINDIAHDQINPFLSIIQSVENLLKKSMRDCFSSIVVVFTKVPHEMHECTVDKTYIGELLKHQILSVHTLDMSDDGRNFVKYLVNHPENIGLFRQANAGPINDAIADGVVQAILGAPGVPDSTLKAVVFPSIAQKSKVFLHKSRLKLVSKKAFDELQSDILDIFKEMLRNYSIVEDDTFPRLKLLGVADELQVLRKKIVRCIESDDNLSNKVDILQMLDPKIGKKITDDRLLEKAKLMEFIDRILELEESKEFDRIIQGILVSMLCKVDELIIAIRLKLNEIDAATAAAAKAALEEERKREIERLERELKTIKRKNEEAEKKLGVFTKIGNTLDDAWSKITSPWSSSRSKVATTLTKPFQ